MLILRDVQHGLWQFYLEKILGKTKNPWKTWIGPFALTDLTPTSDLIYPHLYGRGVRGLGIRRNLFPHKVTRLTSYYSAINSKNSEAVYNSRGVRNITLRWWSASLHCYHNERKWCVHVRKVILGGKYQHKYLFVMRAKHQKGLMLCSLCSHQGHYLFALVSKTAWWVMNTACTFSVVEPNQCWMFTTDAWLQRDQLW